ncbi:MAG TPA: hypothetical protein VMW41_03395 [Candidatus Bathyarchaeia archaeon]|nr:hypothetical protein [Candidatus Bathyarchaeia archaeon]
MPRAEKQRLQTPLTNRPTTINPAPTVQQISIAAQETSSAAQDAGPAKEAAKEVATEVAKEAAKEAVRDSLPRYTEILGVFVALFTFVSIEIQIFSKITSLANAAIFTFLIFLCMVGFLFMLHLIINLKSGNFREVVISAILPVLSLLSIIAIGFFLICYLIKNDIPLNKQESKEIEEIKEKSTKHDNDIENLKELIQHSRK